jgi:uncharacterized protein YciI
MMFVYCYSMKRDPDAVRQIAPEHATYWRDLRLPEYLGGPFEDRTGGLICFEAPERERAAELVAADPFQAHGLVDHTWLKVWVPE